MTGIGSPCGACKFLRRKCVNGCVFAPYFSHEHGAAHFAAIHKVFGASNVSKLLIHLPVADRCEAALTISYEARARLQDPIYGCVSHIFALQQQVFNLQEQLASLKAQASQGLVNGCPITSNGQFPIYQQDTLDLHHLDELRSVPQSHQNPTTDDTLNALHNDNWFMDENHVVDHYHYTMREEGEQILEGPYMSLSH
ncbi:hypothetical protein Scep_029876 [Stephania cephalantha]|uniref:LOB domain-containing protein n=1 Tax=Stephania cephalantha TaxID=152367 RepID=A0AAP0E1G2_9MAGN